jgi:hypothetical protein
MYATHGSASGLSLATNNTYHYLVFLKTKISKILENDGNMLDASKIDQSKFHYLNSKSLYTFHTLFSFLLKPLHK